MKKLMIMALAAVSAMALNAATVSWTITNVKQGDAGVSGTAYVFFVAGDSADTSWATGLANKGAAAVKDAIASAGANISYQNSNAGIFSYTTAQGFTLKSNADLGLTGDTQYTAYAIIFDSAEITDASKFIVTGTRTANTYEDSSSSNRAFAIGSQASATWNAVAVPEPTSGLLMLVGLAGLALRRRRA